MIYAIRTELARIDLAAVGLWLLCAQGKHMIYAIRTELACNALESWVWLRARRENT